MAIQKITAAVLGNNAVTAASVAAGTLSAADIADNSITAAKISASTSPTLGGLTVNGNAELIGNAISLDFMESDQTDKNLRLRANGGVFSVQTLSDNKGTQTQRLQVSHTTGDVSFYEDTGTTQKFYWDASAESLGIGTNSPTTAKLHVEGDGIAIKLDGTANTTRTIFFRNTTSSNPAQIYSDGSLRLYTEDAGTDIRFHTNSTGTNNERMRIDSSGRVLINNSNWEHGQLQVTADPSGTGSFSRGLAVGFQDNASEGDSTGVSFFSKIAISGVKWETARIANETRNVTASIYGDLLFYTNHATTFKERMRINSEGAITRSYDNNRYVKRDAKTIGSNFNNPSQTIITVAASGNTNSTILIKVRVFQAVYASNTGNEQIGVASAMWTGSAWQFQAPTMTVTNGALTSVGTLSWSNNILSYTGNRVGNYDQYYIDYEIFNQNPTNSDSQITYGF